MNSKIALLILLPLLSNCTTLKDSLISGASLGAVGGGLIGNSQEYGDQRNHSTQNGAMIGAVVGAGVGYLAHKSQKNKKAHNEQSNQNSNEKEIPPFLTRPKVKRLWVEDKVQGNRFIRGHWEYVIEEQSEWSAQ